MTRYELATLHVERGAMPKAAPPIAGFAAAGSGRLLGCWAADVGALNTLFVLRGFAGDAELNQERERTLHSANPFGCAEFLTGMSLDSYVPFPGQAPIDAGAFGPVYEIRTYAVRPGGLEATLSAWSERIAFRTAFSRLLVAMYAQSGAPRITHIWPYADTNERARVRAESVKSGTWPPKMQLLREMQSALCTPAAGSPLT